VLCVVVLAGEMDMMESSSHQLLATSMSSHPPAVRGGVAGGDPGSMQSVDNYSATSHVVASADAPGPTSLALLPKGTVKKIMAQQLNASAAARMSEEQVLISGDAMSAMVRAANAFVPYVAICAHEEASQGYQGQGQQPSVTMQPAHVLRAAAVMQVGL
jgi:hypothetical protein